MPQCYCTPGNTGWLTSELENTFDKSLITDLTSSYIGLLELDLLVFPRLPELELEKYLCLREPNSPEDELKPKNLTYY